QQLLGRIAAALAIDPQPLLDNRMLSLLSTREVGLLAAQGFDVQLHTHRHRFPSNDHEAAMREVTENRTRLEAITRRPAQHFCYPSGIFPSGQWPWLAQLGVASATTCLPGLNHRGTHRYCLRRFLDSEDVRFIEFQAELAGFNEILRTAKSVLRGSSEPSG